MEEEGVFPNLIVVDGGKGQLSSACEALQELGLYGKIPIIGIAKKLEEIYYPEDPLPLHINKKSPGLMLLQKFATRPTASPLPFTGKKEARPPSQHNWKTFRYWKENGR